MHGQKKTKNSENANKNNTKWKDLTVSYN